MLQRRLLEINRQQKESGYIKDTLICGIYYFLYIYFYDITYYLFMNVYYISHEILDFFYVDIYISTCTVITCQICKGLQISFLYFAKFTYANVK